MVLQKVDPGLTSVGIVRSEGAIVRDIKVSGITLFPTSITATRRHSPVVLPERLQHRATYTSSLKNPAWYARSPPCRRNCAAYSRAP